MRLSELGTGSIGFALVTFTIYIHGVKRPGVQKYGHNQELLAFTVEQWNHFDCQFKAITLGLTGMVLSVLIGKGFFCIRYFVLSNVYQTMPFQFERFLFLEFHSS